MAHPRDLPDGLEYVRTTDVFDAQHHPAGLLRAHRVAAGVWARLVVHTGAVDFTFDDDAEHPITVNAGERQAIPPERLHHLTFIGPVTFALEFHRQPTGETPTAGDESTGLAP